jgi:hypothetical protein
MPEWELGAIQARIQIIMTQREEANYFVDGADIALNGDDEDEP